MPLKDIIEKFKRKPVDLLGIDLGEAGVNAVRMRKNGEEVSLTAAEILPALDIPTPEDENAPRSISALPIPSRLKAKYVSLALPGDGAVIKLLSFPGQFGAESEEKVVENLGVENPEEHRVSYKLIIEGRGKSESRVLAVAIPEAEAGVGPALFPTGLPAPFSTEISGLASMSAFLHSLGPKHKNEAVGAIAFGTNTSFLALFNNGTLSLFRKFNIGSGVIRERVQKTLGVDAETAQGIITDGAFDISQAVNDVLDPFNKQLVVSRDFVERRENCHVAAMYVSGDMATSHDSLESITSAIGLDVAQWNPFENVSVGTGALPENLSGQEWRFAAAAGACLATFEES